MDSISRHDGWRKREILLDNSEQPLRGWRNRHWSLALVRLCCPIDSAPPGFGGLGKGKRARQYTSRDGRPYLVSRVLPNRPPNPLHRFRQPRKHHFSVKPQHPIPKPGQVTLPASIRNTAPSVITAINFNDKVDAGCKKIHDVTVTNKHLAPKRNAELTARYLGPKRGFRRCELVAHFVGALGEEDLAVELLPRLIAHDVLPLPSKSAGLRGTWRKLRDRREPLLTLIAGGWRGGCAALAETG